MFHEVRNVKALKDRLIELEFETGEIKIYDMKPLFNKYERLKKIEGEEAFKDVKVILDGFGIAWGDETDVNCVDIECDELWYNGKEIEKK